VRDDRSCPAAVATAATADSFGVAGVVIPS